MRYPVDAPIVITTGFGVIDSNSKFGRHTGLDIAKPTGSKVYAPHAGKVTDVNSYQYNGLVIQIFDGHYYHRMLHNSKILVNVGQSVAEGQQVAVSGNTGLSSGPHCHWDICAAQWPTSFAQFINPSVWLATKPPVTQPGGTATVLRTAYVRSAPHVSAPLAGSQVLQPGQTFKYVAKVIGENVNGNNVWYKSAPGNYIWGGNIKG